VPSPPSLSLAALVSPVPYSPRHVVATDAKTKQECLGFPDNSRDSLREGRKSAGTKERAFESAGSIDRSIDSKDSIPREEFAFNGCILRHSLVSVTLLINWL
jgi:hypothetical protein